MPDFGIKELAELISLFDKGDLTSLRMKVGDTEVWLAKGDATSSVPPSVNETEGNAAATPRAVHEPAEQPGGHGRASGAGPVAEVSATIVEVLAPALGVFYTGPKPTDPPFVQVGDLVEPDTTVGLIEAMKVFSAVSAGVSGRVVKLLVDNNEFVEYDQPVMQIDSGVPGNDL